MLEVAGDLDEFAVAVSRIAGMEFLADELGELLDGTDEFATVTATGVRKPVRRDLYMVATDRQAWSQVLSLYERFKRDGVLGRPHGRWQKLFEQLIDLRGWNDNDRLARTGAIEAWQQELEGLTDVMVSFEVELWYRGEDARRAQAQSAVIQSLEDAGGHVVASTIIDEIAYHGILGQMPAQVLWETANRREIAWLASEGVRYLRPTGQASSRVDERSPTAPAVALRLPPPQGAPRAALLDGLPIANHPLLAGRLIVDDPDDWGATQPARRREHGTAMASLIIHGDLEARDAVIPEPIYVRPILKVDAEDWVAYARETIPLDRLPVDLVHEAVARMFVGDNAAAPTVRVINLSVGDAAQQYDSTIGPWARLLDVLADRHEVLFLVSAGNHLQDLEIAGDTDLGEPAAVQDEVLRALARDALGRRLLSPAESMNALTIGALHRDNTGPAPDTALVDPLVETSLPSTISSWGQGHRRSLKPDLLLPGGRQLLEAAPTDGEIRLLRTVVSASAPGLRVATPSTGPQLDRTGYTRGTSAANALGTRAALKLLGRLDELRGLWGSAMPDAEFDSVLLKALLVHGANWGPAAPLIRDAMAEIGVPAGRSSPGRALGYGSADPARALVDDDHRVTAVYATRIATDEQQVFRLPLPPSLASTTVERRITATLAWFSPTNVRHRNYRSAALALTAPAGRDEIVDQRLEADSNAAKRGTLQHEVLEGSNAVPFVDGTALEFAVNCRADAGDIAKAVPYALAVTLEVPERSGIPVYTEVRDRIALRVPIRSSR